MRCSRASACERFPFGKEVYARGGGGSGARVIERSPASASDGSRYGAFRGTDEVPCSAIIALGAQENIESHWPGADGEGQS